MAAMLRNRTALAADLRAGVRRIDAYRLEDGEATEDRYEVTGTAVTRHPNPRGCRSIAIPASDVGRRYHQLLCLILDLHYRVRRNGRAYGDCLGGGFRHERMRSGQHER